MEGYRVTEEHKDFLSRVPFDEMKFHVICDIYDECFIFKAEGDYCIEKYGWNLTLEEFIPAVQPSLEDMINGNIT